MCTAVPLSLSGYIYLFFLFSGCILAAPRTRDRPMSRIVMTRYDTHRTIHARARDRTAATAMVPGSGRIINVPRRTGVARASVQYTQTPARTYCPSSSGGEFYTRNECMFTDRITISRVRVSGPRIFVAGHVAAEGLLWIRGKSRFAISRAFSLLERVFSS